MANHPTQRPIHLSIGKNGTIRVRCDSNRPAEPGVRLTRYPALTTCEECRANFTDAERVQARGYDDDPDAPAQFNGYQE